MNAILRYPGGKWSLAPWIISFFPTHKVYIEPFAGGGAVFFGKEETVHETINDIDGLICNFFRICRDQPRELAALLRFTPYARAEYENVREERAGEQIRLTGNDLEDARRFVVRCNMAMGGKMADRCGWKNKTKCFDGGAFPDVWRQLPETVMKIAERLKHAQIENRPALELIERYNAPDCLIYADPPYLMETRRSRIYRHEMGAAEEHEQLLRALLNHSGPVVLSGYDNELYNVLLKGWHTETKQTRTNSSAIKTEKLWMNFAPKKEKTLFHYGGNENGKGF